MNWKKWASSLPPRSPDLSPLIYFVWSYLRSLAYSTPVTSLKELRERIAIGCEIMRKNPEIFHYVFPSLNCRLEACVKLNGAPF